MFVQQTAQQQQLLNVVLLCRYRQLPAADLQLLRLNAGVAECVGHQSVVRLRRASLAVCVISDDDDDGAAAGDAAAAEQRERAAQRRQSGRGVHGADVAAQRARSKPWRSFCV